ncbi:unnamed protein product [Acanthoscelides obtectus]|uniref:Uncharacterized protein n=1 Tax=Acanthoscelides obtectus TaxID=200917 RepID=A0A9P0M990_ACAOB|nr:unnamed protein product [Acanthoscelides obtectus]CAK1626588.1 hypothetical protein AOBTE_LOCUS3957 [Acanthoscelides obtectus]
MWHRASGPAHRDQHVPHHSHPHPQHTAPALPQCHSPDCCHANRRIATTPSSIHALRKHHVHSQSASLLRHHPRLHFPPPPSYPPSDMEEYLNAPGPSTRPDPPWPVGAPDAPPSPWPVGAPDAPPPNPAEYSYAYLEEGGANAASGGVPYGGPYREGSYRTRHTYLTRYGTEENIYEEISDLTKARRRAAQQKQQHYHHAHQESIMSLHQSLVEEEVRRVQSGHMRVLGELNLSVEAMLMPSNSREGSDDTDRENEDQLADLLTVGPTDELLSPVPLGGDLDSGFSGSSSSASYRSAAGSLRRGPDRPRSSCGAANIGGSGCKTPDGGSTKGFWGKKAWKKIASFPSNISLNKSKGEWGVVN